MLLHVCNSIGIEWVQEERVTLFTADGLIQIGGSMVPRRITSTSDVCMLISFLFSLINLQSGSGY